MTTICRLNMLHAPMGCAMVVLADSQSSRCQGLRMDFYAVLDEVLELLQRHKRVTYRALKRQFGLDDTYLEDLKAEIIEARQLAVMFFAEDPIPEGWITFVLVR